MRNWQTVTNTETVRFTSHERRASEWWQITLCETDGGDSWELVHVGETGEVNDNGNARYRFTSHGVYRFADYRTTSCLWANDVIDAIERGANQ